MNATTTARDAEREKELIPTQLSEKEIDRFAGRMAALVAAEPGAIDQLCRRIDELLAGSRKL